MSYLRNKYYLYSIDLVEWVESFHILLMTGGLHDARVASAEHVTFCKVRDSWNNSFKTQKPNERDLKATPEEGQIEWSLILSYDAFLLFEITKIQIP